MFNEEPLLEYPYNGKMVLIQLSNWTFHDLHHILVHHLKNIALLCCGVVITFYTLMTDDEDNNDEFYWQIVIHYCTWCVCIKPWSSMVGRFVYQVLESANLNGGILILIPPSSCLIIHADILLSHLNQNNLTSTIKN